VLALVFSLLLALYLIIPEALFRIIFGMFVPLRSFVLSKTETAYRAVGVVGIPLLAGYLFVLSVPLAQRHPFHFEDTWQLRRADYKVLLATMYSEKEFSRSTTEFWPALTRSSRRQGRLAVWYYGFVIVFALSGGMLARFMPYLRKYVVHRNVSKKVYELVLHKILVRYISQWYVLLTPFLVPGSTIQADILCVDGTLYRGQVFQHYLDEGKLSGIILIGPERFDRTSYRQAKDADENPDKNMYWIRIPSENLYFFADKILNLNLRYANPENMREFITKQLGETGLSITVDTESDAEKGKPPIPPR
jgi:hypothetical protein